VVAPPLVRVALPPLRPFRGASLEAFGRSSHPALANPGFASPGLQSSWPSARLASLHRRSPHGSRSPAMALLRFRVSTAHQARSVVAGSSLPAPSASWVRPTWRLAPDSALPGNSSQRRSRDSPLEAFPRPDGCRFPDPCPLVVPRRRSIRVVRRLTSGLCPPGGVTRGSGAASSGFLRVSL